MAIGVWRQAGGATGPLLYGIRQQPRLARVGIGGAPPYPGHRITVTIKVTVHLIYISRPFKVILYLTPKIITPN